jgi:hypothetical protein
MHDGHGSGSVWFVCLLKTKQNRKMLSDDSDEFFDKFEGYTIPKKKKKVVDEGKYPRPKWIVQATTTIRGRQATQAGKDQTPKKRRPNDQHQN